MASNILKTLVPRPLMAVLPVPSEQMMMFFAIAAQIYHKPRGVPAGCEAGGG
jgi:hypothetical protein